MHACITKTSSQAHECSESWLTWCIIKIISCLRVIDSFFFKDFVCVCVCRELILPVLNSAPPSPFALLTIRLKKIFNYPTREIAGATLEE